MNQNKKVLLPIFTNLATDYRCYKVASSLKKLGYEPVIICNKPFTELGPNWYQFEIKIITKTSLLNSMCYLEFIIRLIPKLLFSKSNLWISEDCFPLLVTSFIGKLLGKTVVYDSHELWQELDTQMKNTFMKKFWLIWQHLGLIFIKKIITVSPFFIEYLEKQYPDKKYYLLPNVPLTSPDTGSKKRLDENQINLIFQGYLRKDTNLDKLFEAMHKNKKYHLTIIGEGLEFESYKRLVNRLKLGNQIKFLGYVPFDQIPAITASADIGINLLSPLSLSLDYTWQNKNFDYVQFNLPVLASHTTAHDDLFKKYKIGVQVDFNSARSILEGLEKITADYREFSDNSKNAKKKLSWENYEEGLLKFIS